MACSDKCSARASARGVSRQRRAGSCVSAPGGVSGSLASASSCVKDGDLGPCRRACWAGGGSQMDFVPLPPHRRARRAWRAPISLVMPPPWRIENGRAVLVSPVERVGWLTLLAVCCAERCSPPRRRPRSFGCGRWSTSTTSSARSTSASGSKSFPARDLIWTLSQPQPTGAILALYFLG